MSTTAEDFLEHHGVKGMKWGVRKDRGHEGERVKTKKLAKLDKQWSKKIYTFDGAIKVHNATAERVNARLPGLNNSPKYKDTRPLDHPGTKLYDNYIRDYQRIVEKSTSEAVVAVHGTSPSGSFKATYDPSGQRVAVQHVDISHADFQWEDLEIPVEVVNGVIVEHQEVDLTHDVLVDDILEHFGVKGMHWGVRRDPSGSHGGDKTDPLKDVSDEDLKRMVSRLQMEQQFRSLSQKQSNKTAIDHGHAFLQSVVLPAAKVAIAGAITARIAMVLNPKKQSVGKTVAKEATKSITKKLTPAQSLLALSGGG